MDTAFCVLNGSRHIAYPLDLHTARARIVASAFGGTFRSGWIVEIEVTIGDLICVYLCTIWPGMCLVLLLTHELTYSFLSDSACKLDEGKMVIDTSVIVSGDVTDWVNATGRVKAYYPPTYCSSFSLATKAEDKKNIRFLTNYSLNMTFLTHCYL